MSAGFDFAAHIGPVARALLGEPTSEKGEELRFGTRGSLAVKVKGEGAGTWFDHEAGEGGGVLDLIRREKGLEGADAIDWLRWIGVEVPEREPPKRRGPGRPSTADYAHDVAGRVRPIAGTPAERYLRDVRGLSGPFAADWGFNPAVYHKGAGRELPALVGVARDAGGAAKFVHAVFLDGATGGKADVEPVKLTFGAMEGAAVRIPARADGPGGAGDDRLALAEGPEDALSVAEATGLETWACCGVSNIGRAEVPAGRTVVVAAQNDPPDKIAAATLRKAVGRLRGRGLRVVVAYPPAGVKDWNDMGILYFPYHGRRECAR